MDTKFGLVETTPTDLRPANEINGIRCLHQRIKDTTCLKKFQVHLCVESLQGVPESILFFFLNKNFWGFMLILRIVF